MTDIKLCEKEECTGCEACLNICPSSALTMNLFHDGFLYPQINEQACMKCKKCVSICPSLHPDRIVLQSQGQKVYSAIPILTKQAFESTSAGIAYSLCCKTLEEEGVVFGARFKRNSDGLYVNHDVASDNNMLEKQRGSKYVQSAIGFTYRQVEKILSTGTEVLFTGTPCQIDALYCFLGKYHENLYTCDLLCAGVPSQSLFSKYVDYLEEVFKAKVSEVNFRSKQYGYGFGNLIAISFSDGHIRYFSHGPKAGISRCMEVGAKRPACFSCRYACLSRVGDISLGDFYDLDCSDEDYQKGVSLVLVNNAKGKALLDKVAHNFKLVQRTPKEALQSNRYALSPCRKKPENINELLKGTLRYSWLEYYERFLAFTGIKKIIMQILPPRIISCIRKMRRNANRTNYRRNVTEHFDEV